MIVFVIFAVVLALILQKALVGRDLDLIEADHRPDVQVVEPDETFRLRVTLTNKSRRIVPFLRVSEGFEESFDLPGCDAPRDSRGVCRVEFTAWLRPRQGLTRTIPLSIHARGRYVLREFQLYTGDFLGLREQMKTCGRFNEVVVAPREVHSEGLADLFGGFMGDVSVNRFIMEDPVLTLGYREYTGREPMKTISWVQSARAGSLMVKKYDYTLEPMVSVVLNVDAGRPDQEELLETCFSLARTVCAMLEQRGVKYDFTSNAVLAGADPGACGEGLGQRHFFSVLEHLGRAVCEHNVSLERLLEREARRGTAAGRILITPGIEAEPVRALNRLREAAGGCLLVLRASEVVQ